MDVKKFSKELAKAVGRFERRCKKEGEICDPVEVFFENGFRLETTIKTPKGFYFGVYADAEIDYNAERIELLYFHFGGMAYDF